MKFIVFWDILPCSQVDVDDIYLTTRHYIPEDSKILTVHNTNLSLYASEFVATVSVLIQYAYTCLTLQEFSNSTISE
jgi:hypothetical protein